MKYLLTVVYNILEIIFRLFYSITKLEYNIIKGVVRVYGR